VLRELGKELADEHWILGDTVLLTNKEELCGAARGRQPVEGRTREYAVFEIESQSMFDCGIRQLLLARRLRLSRLRRNDASADGKCDKHQLSHFYAAHQQPPLRIRISFSRWSVGPYWMHLSLL
jgi:hypothetical protein